MITELAINNYKSTLKTVVPLAAFTVLIGENGAGKSNILETLVLASAASANKLDTEYLNARGVRLCSSSLTTSAFVSDTKNKPISIIIKTDTSLINGKPRIYKFILRHNDSDTIQWKLDAKSTRPLNIQNYLLNFIKNKPNSSTKEIVSQINGLSKELERLQEKFSASDSKHATIEVQIDNPQASEMLDGVIYATEFSRFTVYSPSLEVLKNPLATPATSPIGPKGEGMLATLLAMEKDEPERYKDVTESLKLFGWFTSIILPEEIRSNNLVSMPRLLIKDKFIRTRGLLLDDNSVNEGFLFVLFYLILFCSSKTPRVFGIENIDVTLNPRLCEVLIKKLITLGQKYSKQAIISTHNPAVLDALNLDDEKQSLVIVRRNLVGHTLAEKFNKPNNSSNSPIKLSELFLRGHIGAIPKGI